jgi:hypothetical protein
MLQQTKWIFNVEGEIKSKYQAVMSGLAKRMNDLHQNTVELEQVIDRLISSQTAKR